MYKTNQITQWSKHGFYIFILFLSSLHLFSSPHKIEPRKSARAIFVFRRVENHPSSYHHRERKACQPYSSPPSDAWTCQQQSKGNSSVPAIFTSHSILVPAARGMPREKKTKSSNLTIKERYASSIHQCMYHIRLPSPER